MNDVPDVRIWEDIETYDTIDTNWNEIGGVVLSCDGCLTGVVVEGGGFPDMGDASALTDMAELRLIDSDFGNYARAMRFGEDDF